MSRELCINGDVCDRQKAYTDFYNSLIEDNFCINEDFINGIQNIFDSENVLPGAFEPGDDLEIHQSAYLLQFGVHDSCLAEKRFRKSTMKCEKLVTLFSKGRINICCLGSQGLLAVIGICEVIEEYAQKHKFEDESRTQVQILIIDKNTTWKRLCGRIVKAAEEKYPTLRLKLHFLEKDITEKISDAVRAITDIAHIVTMVRFVSNLTSKETVSKVIKDISNSMKKNAVLFYLDHDTRDDLTGVKKLITESKSFTEINCSMSPEKYVLHDSTKLHHKSLYECLFFPEIYWDEDITPMRFSTWIKNPEVKIERVEERQKKPVTGRQHDGRQSVEDPDKFYRAKKSSNTKRNSSETFRLVGKFALKDMEKRNKDDSHRHIAKDVAASRYADFDDW